ncbi:MAG: cytochrome c5 family protein [Ruegeria sp.]|uniref:c-type cytochrome n=1 Tax=Ruegeria sp. TaxID=1879320 RepID=UPI00349E9131
MNRPALLAILASIVVVDGYLILGPRLSLSAGIPAPSASQIAYAESAVPGDDGLAAIYDRTCRACHAIPEGEAPLTGHAAAWQARLEGRGLDALVASVKTGMGTMPAMGFCADCSDADFKRLIEFMATEGT